MQYSKDSPNAFRRLRRRGIPPREKIQKMRRSRTADNFKFFFGGIKSKNSRSEYLKDNEFIKISQ